MKILYKQMKYLGNLVGTLKMKSILIKWKTIILKNKIMNKEKKNFIAPLI